MVSAKDSAMRSARASGSGTHSEIGDGVALGAGLGDAVAPVSEKVALARTTGGVALLNTSTM